MSHIPNAIAMLGLSIGEIFKIQERPSAIVYRYTEDGPQYKIERSSLSWNFCSITDKLLSGKFTIVKIPQDDSL